MNLQIENNKHLFELYFKAKPELRIMEANLRKNFSIILLNNCYKVKQLLNELENLLDLKKGIIPIP